MNSKTFTKFTTIYFCRNLQAYTVANYMGKGFIFPLHWYCVMVVAQSANIENNGFCCEITHTSQSILQHFKIDSVYVFIVYIKVYAFLLLYPRVKVW